MDYGDEFRRALSHRGYQGAVITPVAAGEGLAVVYAIEVADGPEGRPLRLQGTVGELGYRLARIPRRHATTPRDKPRGANKRKAGEP